jgi:signal transduction histidine kinase/DNA-binding response OmpR family regulator
MPWNSIVVSLVLACAVIALAIALGRAASLNARLRAELRNARHAAVTQEDDLRQRKQLDTIKDEFISTVSHELRTPLTSIRGALGLLSAGLMGHVDEKAANLLRIASSNTDRLVRLINDILDLERMDSGRAPMQFRPCSLPELIVQSVETMNSMAEGAGVKIQTVPEPFGMPAAFEGDPDRIQQVLVNLLSNAIKFSPSGNSILIRTGCDADSLYLHVEDAGRGVPTEKLESIFDRFNQVESSDARQKGGTGLGLAICRTILTQHNGAIWAERNDRDGSSRAGTTFVVRIPRSREAERLAALPLPSATLGPILVVDDDAGVRQIIAEHLRHHGYTVLETASGEHAIHIAEAEPVEAILLDLYMPGLSGWETIERLKRNPKTAGIPVVVLSVLSPAARTSGGPPLISNAQGWVQKPFHEGLLLAELSRVLHPGSGPGRVLLVEDDEDLATVVMAGFETASDAGSISLHHVSSLIDAQHACEIAPPDLLILDLTLPDGSGFALVDWLRRQPTLRTLPLVVYSGRDVTLEEKEQLRLGPTQFLAKARVQPRDVEELVLAMVSHLRSTAALESGPPEILLPPTQRPN